jgi:hypothetical protein
VDQVGILHGVVRWAEHGNNVRAVLLDGSVARDDGSVDEWSDLDVRLCVPDRCGCWDRATGLNSSVTCSSSKLSKIRIGTQLGSRILATHSRRPIGSGLGLRPDQTLAFAGEAVSRACAGVVASACGVVVKPPDAGGRDHDESERNAFRGLALTTRRRLLGHGQTVPRDVTLPIGAVLAEDDLSPRDRHVANNDRISSIARWPAIRLVASSDEKAVPSTRTSPGVADS